MSPNNSREEKYLLGVRSSILCGNTLLLELRTRCSWLHLPLLKRSSKGLESEAVKKQLVGYSMLLRLDWWCHAHSTPQSRYQFILSCMANQWRRWGCKESLSHQQANGLPLWSIALIYLDGILNSSKSFSQHVCLERVGKIMQGWSQGFSREVFSIWWSTGHIISNEGECW